MRRHPFCYFFLLTLAVVLVGITIRPAMALALEARNQKGAETLSLPLPVSGEVKVFTLENPPRIVIDIPSYKGTREAALPKAYKGAIRNIRVGQYNPETVRIVLDLAQSASKVSNHIKGNSLILSFTTSAPARAMPAPQKRASEERTKKPAPPGKNANRLSRNTPASEQKQVTKPKVKPLIVIDAGHGGQDPGAQGSGGTQEKHIVLEYAKALKSALLATKRYRVKLTRETDRFILLRERTAIARHAEGDLFISLHADSAPGADARGLSVYSLSENASDKEAEMLAISENRADILSGMDLSRESEDVANILISLAQRETNNTSAQLADILVYHVRKQGVQTIKNPHRFAGFAVLKAPDMPSVLIETGFISSPEEEKQLLRKKYREQMVKGIVHGIDSFFQKRQEGIL